jgi:hypothetical protein
VPDYDVDVIRILAGLGDELHYDMALIRLCIRLGYGLGLGYGPDQDMSHADIRTVSRYGISAGR